MLCHKYGTICYVLEDKRRAFWKIDSVVQNIFSAYRVAIAKTYSLKCLMLDGDIRDEKNWLIVSVGTLCTYLVSVKR